MTSAVVTRRPLYGLLGSTGLSVSGNAMVLVIIPWLVLRQTGSAASAGLVNSAALVVGMVALLGGAALLDRWDRRALSIGADLMSAVSVAALPFFDATVGLSLGLIFVLVAAGALFDGPGRAAREVLRPSIADHAGLTIDRVNAMGEVMDGIGRVAGPAAAGIAVAAIGFNNSLWITAGLFVTAALTLGATQRGITPPPVDTTNESYLTATTGGFRIVWADPALRSTAIALSMFGLFVTPLVLVLTAEFEASDRAAALGAVITAFAAGGIGGGIAFATYADKVRRRVVLIAGFTFAAVAFTAMGLVLDSLPALIAVAAVTGIVASHVNPVLSVIMQDRAPEQYRGRVFATLVTMELIAAPLGMVAAGVLIEATSPRTALFVIAVGPLITAIFTTVTPGLRTIERGELAETVRSRPEGGQAGH